MVITRRKSPLQRKVFTRNEGKQGPSLPYIPSGSFAKAMLIEGADANASVTGNESTVAVFVLISLLVNVRTSVQIIDNSDLVKVHRVDNVPVGLAMPLSLTTRIGHAMVVSYEMIFTQPDSVTYSKTGMLFGANLIVKSTDFLSRNPEIINLFQDYVQNCVLGDIYLNHKYTLEDLMASADPYTLIFSRPSPLRGVYDNNNNFITCKDASVTLKDRLNLDTKTGGKTWHYYVQQIFGGRPDPDLLF
ncbi:conjugal transfer protein TraG N-terminal domain-containing protein, partial [Escherichia coli]|nr:conjugal transfer protein TraG N-terminal domain-containing protein [Escherichia coli]MDH7436104.1 conjugal transfer protein TraG N-terminal domain-containing protein [Escherichia coli]